MMKRSIQDIVVKKATKQIPKKITHKEEVIPRRTSKQIPKQFHFKTEEVFYEEMEAVVRGPAHDLPPIEPNQRSQKAWWLITFSSVAVLLFALSFFFSGAKITLTPKIVPVTLKEEVFIAKKTAPSGSLGFEIMSLSGEVSKTIISTNSKEVNTKAQGEVMLYNSFSTKSERITKGSTLVATNGKTYKTDATVTIPGYTLDKAKKVIPGSARVLVTASVAGAESNQEATDLAVQSLSSTKKEKIYARSVGAFSGGQVGMIAVLDEATRTQARDELTEALRQKLLSQAEVQIPKDFLLYPESAKIVFETKEIPIEGDQTAISMVQSGTVFVPLMNRKILSQVIAKIAYSQYDNASIQIPELQKLTFAYESPDVSDIQNLTEIRFHLIGDAHVVWDIDIEGLRTALLGVREKDFRKTTSAYLSIDTAELTITPFWIKTIPEKREKITILLKNTILNQI